MSQKLPLLIVFALLLAGGVFWLSHEKAIAPTVPVQEPTQTMEPTQEPSQERTQTVDTSDWKTYRNEQIGIQFEYPASWGDITVSREVGCVDYYVENVVIPENPKDSCLHFSLSASNFKNGAFLGTEGIDYTKTKIPRGSDWQYRLAALSKEKENFCSYNPYLNDSGKLGHLKDCETFKTRTSLVVTKGEMAVPFAGNEVMTVYFIRTNHPVYYDVVVSSVYLQSATAADEIKRLIDTMVTLDK